MSQEKNGDPHGTSGPKRPRYFHGMLLDERDFEAEQTYHVSRRRLLNRMLHGSGVVCGLELQAASGRELQIGPGLALDGRGREIWVEREHRIDLCELPGLDDPSLVDPCACEDLEEERKKYHVCLYYWECGSDPVSNHVSDDECISRGCDNSRVREGYGVRLTECERPECVDGLLGWLRREIRKYAGETFFDEAGEIDQEKVDASVSRIRGSLQGWLDAFCCQPVPCPCGCDCGDDCIVIGSITLDEKGCLVDACSNDCRPYVLTGPLLRHLFVSILGYCPEKKVENGAWIPSAVDVARNPIEILCRFLGQAAGEETQTRMMSMAMQAPEGLEDVRRGRFDRVYEAWRRSADVGVREPRRRAEGKPGVGAWRKHGWEKAPTVGVVRRRLAEDPGLVGDYLEAERSLDAQYQRVGVFRVIEEVAARREDREVTVAAARAREEWEARKAAQSSG